MNTRSEPDRLLAALAGLSVRASLRFDPGSVQSIRRALTDSFAVALGGLQHPGARIARRYARLCRVGPEPALGATLWGSGERVSLESAALANAAPLRGYDYNDLYVGRSAGHPSDIIPGMLALAQACGADGQALMEALALGYQVCLELFDTFDLQARGWDYPVVSALAATCAAARLVGLSESQARDALGITATAHFASDEVESGELNGRGELTLWKRFNAGHAVRHALYAVLLAREGAEGAVRPFEGRAGLLSKIGMDAGDIRALVEKLDATASLARAGEVSFKRWPVGSRAQSAIQSALQARELLMAAGLDPWQAQAVRVRCDAQAYSHLVSSRAAPYHPASRDTADHSLPYIVACAVLDGQVSPDSFGPKRLAEVRRSAFVAGRVQVEPADVLSQGAAAGFLAQVQIIGSDGRSFAGMAAAAPGHPRNPFSDAQLAEKLMDNVAPLFGLAHARQLFALIGRLGTAQDVAELCRLTVVADPALLDAGPAG
jgi:2-methylcitrate dehydratase